jgi:hypothetical protein
MSPLQQSQPLAVQQQPPPQSAIDWRSKHAAPGRQQSCAALVALQGRQLQSAGEQTQSPVPVQSQAGFVKEATAQAAPVKSSATLNTERTTYLLRMKKASEYRGSEPRSVWVNESVDEASTARRGHAPDGHAGRGNGLTAPNALEDVKRR